MNELRSFIDETLLPALSIEAAYSWPGHNFAEAGDRLRGACPFHESKTGSSFVVTPSNGLWWCQGCTEGGDVFKYRHKLSGGNGTGPRGSAFVDLVRALCSEAGVAFPERELTLDEKRRAEQASRNRSELEEVYARASARLWTPEGDGARSWLHSRGVTDETIREYGLGLAGEEVREDDRGYILLPWRDERGRPLTYYLRLPGPPSRERPKTKAMPGEGTKRSPFALDRVRGEEVVVVEGDLDTLILRQAGEDRVVSGISGTLPQAAIECIARRGIRRAFICGDPDGGGRNGNESHVRRLHKSGIETYVLEELPDGQDPDEYVLAHGIDAWRERAKAALPGWTWIGVQCIGEITPASVEAAKRTVIRETLDAIAGCPTLDREAVLRRLSEATGYSVAALDESPESRPDATKGESRDQEGKTSPWINLDRFREELRQITRTRVATGLPTLDRATEGGISGDTVILLVGPVGSCKSALASQLARGRALTYGGRVYVYAPDQGGAQYLKRLASTFGNIAEDDEAFARFVAGVEPVLRVIDERRDGVTIEAFRDLVLSAGDVASVIVDTPQTVATAEDEEERQRIQKATSIARDLTSELLVPVYVCSHANRAATAARNKQDRTLARSAGLGDASLEHRAQVMLFMERRDGQDGGTEIDVEIPKAPIANLRCRLRLDAEEWRLREVDLAVAEAAAEEMATRTKREKDQNKRFARRDQVKEIIRTAKVRPVPLASLRDAWRGTTADLPKTLAAMVVDKELSEVVGPVPERGGWAPKFYELPRVRVEISTP
jgi:archaellum biogenesis ATPase FlaH